jgi:hypothetical protein
VVLHEDAKVEKLKAIKEDQSSLIPENYKRYAQVINFQAKLFNTAFNSLD